MKTAFSIIFNNCKVLITICLRKMNFLFSDRIYLKLLFRCKVGYSLNLDQPQTYNEKLQWLKLNNHHLEYTKMVDKVTAKDYVASKIGNKYIIPTLGVWDSINDINWDMLPDQFVIKVTSDSGGIVVCKDKSQLDIEMQKKDFVKDGVRTTISITKNILISM